MTRHRDLRMRMGMGRGTAIATVGFLLAAGLVVEGNTGSGQAGGAGRDVAAKGAFTCDLAIPIDMLSDSDTPAIMEIDRMYMAERPGQLRKYIPAGPDPANERVLTGGRYLFDTAADAVAYKRWVEEDFALDGTLFLERPYFLERACHAWRVVGATDFAELRTSHVNLRTEYLDTSGDEDRFTQSRLVGAWPDLRAEASARGMASVMLLHDPGSSLVGLVYLAGRTTPANPLTPDVAGLAALQAAPPLGDLLKAFHWERVLDRTQWVMSIWFPYAFADRGERSLWPNSPGLPEPSAKDGVCEPSRGETHGNARADCSRHCGNGFPNIGETTRTCPSDVRPSFTAT